jgi:PhzF family phenazine biosynthesis protein
MRVDVQIVNAFIDGEAGGNPAGVVLGADPLTAAQKLDIARRVGLSETAFVSSSRQATAKLEFFTPTRQIAHCGHATVASFSLMRQRGLVGEGRHSKETIDGHRDILVEGDLVFMEQRAPRYTPVAAGSELAARVWASLGWAQAGRPQEIEACVVNTGNAFLVVPVPDEPTLAGLRPDPARVEAISEELDLIGYYVFCRSTRQPGRHAAARMFAPRFGIAEEAGTGMAAGPLACFLHDRLALGAQQVFIEQGWLMAPPSPSVITVRLQLHDGRVSGLMAGGTARAVSSLRLEA